MAALAAEPRFGSKGNPRARRLQMATQIKDD
jgi:hypothetical protein